MKTYLLSLWDTLRGSYWFIPATLGLVALMLSIVMPQLDAAICSWGYEHFPFVQTTTNASRSTLSAIAGASATVAGTVFSITIVTLSLTSQQFGPRLLRMFMLDMPTQWTLGIFVSTSLYCLLVLRVVEDHDGISAPHLSVAVAVLMAVFSLAMLIFFVHHVSVLIQAPQVVKAVAADLNSAIDRLYPESIGSARSDAVSNTEKENTEKEQQLGDPHRQILSTKEGYIQAINGEGLMSLARRKQLVFRLQVRPGDFLRHDAPLSAVWSDSVLTDDDAKDIGRTFNEAVIVGMRRTPRQDVKCAVNELVEVAVRSLSPGVNDPFTAMNCIDYLAASLCRLVKRDMPSEVRYDSEGHLRVIAAQSTKFPDVLHTAFDPIRQYSGETSDVKLRLLEALAVVAQSVVREEDRDAIRRQAEMVHRSGVSSLPEQCDRDKVQAAYERVLECLGLGKNS